MSSRKNCLVRDTLFAQLVMGSFFSSGFQDHLSRPSSERVAEWLRRLTHKPKVRTAVVLNPTRGSLVAVRYTSPGRPEPYEGNLVAVAGSCGGVMVNIRGPCWK